LPAQVSVHLSVGARYTTTLVRDSIVTNFSVRPAIAPALALTVGTPIDTTGKWTVEAILDWSHSDMIRHDADGSTQAIGGLGTLAFSVGMRRNLLPWLSARAFVGGLKYLPASKTGIFSLGSGSLSPLAGLAWRRRRLRGALGSGSRDARGFPSVHHAGAAGRRVSGLAPRGARGARRARRTGSGTMRRLLLLSTLAAAAIAACSDPRRRTVSAPSATTVLPTPSRPTRSFSIGQRTACRCGSGRTHAAMRRLVSYGVAAWEAQLLYGEFRGCW